LALFFPEKKDKPADGLPATVPNAYMIATADMGEHAADWDQLLEKLFDQGVRDKKITTERDTYQEVQFTIVRPVVDEDAAKKQKERKRRVGDPGEDDAAEDPPPSSGLAAFIGGSLDDRRAVRIGRIVSVFIACTEPHAFEDAVDAMKGKNIDALADASDFRAALDQHPAG